jgi:hypothetical protein
MKSTCTKVKGLGSSHCRTLTPNFRLSSLAVSSLSDAAAHVMSVTDVKSYCDTSSSLTSNTAIGGTSGRLVTYAYMIPY